MNWLKWKSQPIRCPFFKHWITNPSWIFNWINHGFSHEIWRFKVSMFQALAFAWEAADMSSSSSAMLCNWWSSPGKGSLKYVKHINILIIQNISSWSKSRWNIWACQEDITNIEKRNHDFVIVYLLQNDYMFLHNTLWIHVLLPLHLDP